MNMGGQVAGRKKNLENSDFLHTFAFLSPKSSKTNAFLKIFRKSVKESPLWTVDSE
jgi:hypothetical protein